MKEDMEYCRIRLSALYQRHQRQLVLAQSRHFKTPMREIELEIAELRGILKGIEKSISLFEKRANENFLPGLDLTEGEKHGT